MKIIHVTTTDMSLRFLLLAQLSAAVERGDEVIGVSAAGSHVPALEGCGMRHIALEGSTRSMNLLADLRAARHLWRIVRQERPDVLHTHNPKPGVYGRVVGRLAGVPAVVNTVHGLYATPSDPLPRRLVVYALEGAASRFSHAELVQNPEDLALLQRLRLVPRRKLRLLGNGVDLARFRPGVLGSRGRQELRAELGIRPEEVVIGTVGRLVYEKGYAELFAAAERLRPGARLVVIGPEDPEKADAVPRSVMEEAGRSGVLFLGHRDDVERFYAVFDVFALPSHREGYPRAAMEAAASGLPLVATDIRGCRQVVEHGKNGFLVPVRQPDALAEALARLTMSEGLRAQMGRQSRVRAEEQFDEGRIVATVMATYAAALAG